MAKLNKIVAALNFHRQKGPRFTPEAQLRRTLLNCLLWEDQFYEDGVAIAERLAALVPQVDPETVAALAIEAREDMKLRHAPLFLVREMARYEKHKLLVAASDGRFYTVGADKLPGGRGFGEPLRLMVDIDPDARIVALIPASADGRLLLASSSGHGFVAQMADVIAETRKGRNVVNLKPKAHLSVVRTIAANHDSVAVIGENRKLVVFPIAEVPVMARGQGVMLQKYRDGGLSDATSFVFAEGLSWTMGGETGRVRTETDLGPWRVARSASGRMPPTGFPRNNRFD